MPPYPKLFRMYLSTCVPIVVLLEQFEQLVSYFVICRWTTRNGSGLNEMEKCGKAAKRLDRSIGTKFGTRVRIDMGMDIN